MHPTEAGDRGGPADFAAFFRAEFSSIALIAGTVCGDRSGGEDIAQESFSRAHSDWSRVSQLDKPGAWVRRVAINLALSRRRRLKRETQALALLRRAPEADQRTDRDVWNAVAKLAPRQRAVIALYYHEGLSVAEIADLLECSVSAATSNLHKARSRLADLLGGSRSGVAQ